MSKTALTLGPTLHEPRRSEAVVLKLRSQLGREWKIGDQLPPVKELARRLGAGQSVTNQAVRALVAEGLLVSRRRTGTRVVHPTGEQGRLRGKTIAVIASNLPFMHRMHDALSRVLAPTGASIERLSSSPTGISLPDAALRSDLIVLLNPVVKLGFVHPDNVPVVVVSTSWDHVTFQDPSFDLVGVDQVHGATLAGKHLRQIGCRSVCFLGSRRTTQGRQYDFVSTARLQGFERGWGEPIPAKFQLDGEGYSLNAGGRGLSRYLALPSRPEAVFASCDDMAFGFLAAAESHGLKPGRDFQLVGFDGQEEDRRHKASALTTVDVPIERMGKSAAQIVIQRLTDPGMPLMRVYLGCSLFVGGTTQPQGS